MTAANNSSSTMKTPQVFTDEELSEIFQIDFAEIFGQTSFPDAKQKTTAEPSKNTVPAIAKKNHINNNKGTSTRCLLSVTEIFSLLRQHCLDSIGSRLINKYC